MSYHGTHRRKTPLHRHLLVRASAVLAIAGSLLGPTLATGTAHAADGCGTATTAAATLTCAEQLFATAVDAIKAQQVPAGVGVPPLPVPITVDTSLFNFVNDTANQAVAEAENCLTQTSPTCALIVRVAQQEAQSIETAVTTCVNGTNALCNQLEQLTTGEISALLTLATNCVGGTDPTCNSLLGTVSQLLGQAVTCAVGPLGPGAPSTLPDLTATCQQVKDAASQVVAGCASGATPGCGDAIVAVEKSPCLNTSDQVACAQATAAPPAVVPADDDPGTIFPTNELRGAIVLGSGVGAAGVTVNFYVAPTMESGTTVTPHLLGSTSTDSTGNYLLTMTPDSYATSLATANGGVLDVLISAAVSVTVPGTVDAPILEVAEGQTPLVIGGSAEYWESQPPTLLLMPAGQTDLSTTPAVDLSAADPTDPTVDPSIHYQPPTNSFVPTFAGVPTGNDPFIVNGVDYQQAIPTGDGGCAPPQHQPYLESYTTIGQKESWNVVGETHSYYDANAEFSYAASTSDSTIETGFSADDQKGWVGGSYSHMKNTNNSNEINIIRGSYYAHQMRMGFLFKNWKIKYQCYNSDKIYYTYEVGPGKCMFDWKEGADVSKYDGYWPYQNSNPQYRKIWPAGVELRIKKGTAYHYTNSFNAFGFWGKSVSGHSTEVIQGIKTGFGDLDHDIWGNNKAIEDGPNNMYSY